jgi:glycyl-tRNA synthetase beta chain
MGKKKSTIKTRGIPKTTVARNKTKSQSNDSLLIELRTEELPPKSLERLSLAFAGGVYASLKEQGFLASDSVQQVYATPRRLAVLISHVLPRQADRMVERKGPAVSTGLAADGQPSPALLGFAKSCGVDADKLQKRSGDKGEYFAYSFKQKGEGLAQHLAGMVEASLKKLPSPKLMRWGDKDVQFVRPAHGLIMLHGRKVVAGEVLGLKSGNKTLGHRFLSKGVLAITTASDYEKILEKQGSVIAAYARRKDMIARGLDAAAKKIGPTTSWALGSHDSLLGEVASIVEYPVVYAGEFSQDFLKVPRECLIISMQQHQKYFPLVEQPRGDKTGRLLARFLFVSNNRSKAPKQVIQGNERVLRARLSDARFFYEQDMKAPLAGRVPKLANVVYHNKLGSQLQRVERIQKLAGEIARRFKARTDIAERAGYLCKADLVTDMVGEFPELQGTMGYYYALHDGEDPLAAQAIREHYLPRYAGDTLPASAEAISVALADKLDTLVGIYGVGLVPTGDKDPFGLRRQALGVIRILMESRNLPSADILELLQLARGHFPSGVVTDSVAQDLYGFMLERLKPYLREKGFLPDEIDAVLSLNPTRLDQVILRLEALQVFRGMPEAAALAAANKRIHNILKQAGGDGANAPAVEPGLLIEAAEKALAERLALVTAKVAPLFAAGNYTDALKALAQLRDPVDAFFDKVMVMADDEKLRRSRLALLHQIRQLFLQAADISRLQS